MIEQHCNNHPQKLDAPECPFCKKTTLGVRPSQFDDLFYTRCVNKACLLNYKTPAPLELRQMAKDALGALADKSAKKGTFLLVVEPRFFLEGVPCPFCHAPTLGVIPIPNDLFYMRCLNKACFLNYHTPVPGELDGLAKDALGLTEDFYEERKRIWGIDLREL